MESSKNKKVVLAYSGGLDTSYTAKYLATNKGLQVISVVANTGGFSQKQLQEIEDKAKALGVTEHVVLELENEYYENCIKYLIYGNILKNNTYPLSVSSERFFQAKAIADYANQCSADYLAHGCTGAGNDQVRFDLVFKLLCPDKPIISLVRDEELSRNEELVFLKKSGIELDFQKMKYSINEGLWGTSIGGKETLTSQNALPEQAYVSQNEQSKPQELTIDFKEGIVKKVNGKLYENPVDAIKKLNELGGKYAIGRGIHVGDTIIGTKGRVGFEAPASYLIIKAHHELEKHTLTKMQMQWKEQLSGWYGTMLHDSMYLEPTMRNVENFLCDTQKNVSGSVKLKLYPYRFEIIGVDSPNDLMNANAGAYGEASGNWTADDVKGFIAIMVNPLKNYYAVNKEELQNI